MQCSVSPLIKASELAQLLSLERRTLYKPTWQRRMGLVPVRLGRTLRFRLEDVHALLTSARGNPAEASRRQRELEQLRRWAERHGIRWSPSEGQCTSPDGEVGQS